MIIVGNDQRYYIIFYIYIHIHIYNIIKNK